MRLLKTQTLEFVEIVRPERTEYAILSHTWGEEEVSLEDFHKPESKRLQGYKKIERCCARARRDGFGYVWIDTCCIDKKSSAELSEAINSMYNWYYQARACYVYLSDFSLHTEDVLERSRWFTRGWTLQELLASSWVHFYDRQWFFIGNKQYLEGQISVLCGIGKGYIQDRESVRTASVAARMSWASNRETSRPEDEAYCLMGLFDVNMPLLYGEGRVKAFRRLQHEIAKNSEDESLFAWHSVGSDLSIGIFAPYPAAFRGCGDIEPVQSHTIRRQPYSITNRGLSIDATYQRISWENFQYMPRRLGHDQHTAEFLLLPLRCAHKFYRKHSNTEWRDDEDDERLITIILTSVLDGPEDAFVRWLPSEIMVYEKYFQPDEELLRRNIFIEPPTSHILLPSPSGAIRVSISTAMIATSHSTTLLRFEEWRQWYVTPPGFIGKAYFGDPRCRIYFKGFTGFAVLQFHFPRTYFVIVRHVVTVSDGRTITLSLHEDSSELEAVVDSCYRQRDLLNIVPDGSAEAPLQVDKDHFIVLERIWPDEYNLGLLDHTPPTPEMTLE
ncbi:MAG: hypothetical protein L6R38_001835 [Xanthoria sp. 2 TBL-2021]|nr:MAG: hypothetical protein L6R38_001835 [Xanthoria sp. 2 TBL-2021]